MVLLPIDSIQVHQEKINEIDKLMKSIYRLIVYSRYHLDDDRIFWVLKMLKWRHRMKKKRRSIYCI